MGKLVQEKQETRGTVARAGVFWVILAVPFVIWRTLSRRKESGLKSRFRRK